MKKSNFLTKLLKKKKIQLVEPNNEVSQAYGEKSESYIISAKILLKNKRLEESISMIYYSMYYSLTSLLFRVGIKCENHSASAILLKKIFEISDREIIFAKKERIAKQYYTDFQIAENDVIKLIKTAEKFNFKIFDFIAKLNNETIKKFRKKMKKITQ